MTLIEAMRKLDSADFRMPGKVKFPASEIAAITVCAIISGASGYGDFADFAFEKHDWLKTFLEMRNGIPSHDTFRYFWQKLNPARFNACFMEWVESMESVKNGDGVHIDGKCLRRATNEPGMPPCIVSAFSSRNRIVVGQVKTEEKSNEITAIPKLLDQLYLSGAIVTIDAAGCQKKIVKKITAKNSDYLISLKDNQPILCKEVGAFFSDTYKGKEDRFQTFRQTDKGHGRIVTRTCTQSAWIDWFEDRHKWDGLKTFCKIETETTNAKTGATMKECRYYISSLDVDAERALSLAVKHWEIENSLHWTLDMTFAEDYSRVRTGFATENLAIMRHLVYDAIRLANCASGGISKRKKKLTWNSDKLRTAIQAS